MFTLTWPVCVPWSVPNPTESVGFGTVQGHTINGAHYSEPRAHYKRCRNITAKICIQFKICVKNSVEFVA